MATRSSRGPPSVVLLTKKGDEALTFRLLRCLFFSGFHAFSFFLAITLSATAAPSDLSESQRTAIALEALSHLQGVDLEAKPNLKAAVLKLLGRTRGTPQFVQIV